MIHPFSSNPGVIIPEEFTNPFRYCPHPLVRKAAREVMERLDKLISSGQISAEVANDFTEGKMLGVLVCYSEERSDVGISYLAAFSGSVGGTSIVEGFVPPIFDLTQDGGYYRTHEAEITAVNKEIERLGSVELEPLTDSLREVLEARDRELAELREMKKGASSIAESQFANGQIKRAKDRWKAVISEAEAKITKVRDLIDGLKKQRAAMSDELQRWIFKQYIVHNASGEKASILDIFNCQGIMPPGGTGDCAAPKLLNYAYANGLKPLAMGEFWYGVSPATAVRTHGHFYPSCTSKCGPLLSYMMQGLEVPEVWDGKTMAAHELMNGRGSTELGEIQFFHPTPSEPCHIYEDEDIVVACKPSGMPSVPGLDGRESLQEWLQKELKCEIIPVHRLDMDTSGIIIYAKTADAEAILKKQLEEHTVKKTYMARLSPADPCSQEFNLPELKPGDKGSIELPLSADYDERPRQKVDKVQGKSSLTAYEVLSVNEDGTTDVLFHPHTGRTHQLRVHSAHLSGLGRPILGDLLYGGCGSVWTETGTWTRLHLHACSITFLHPATSNPLTFQL